MNLMMLLEMAAQGFGDRVAFKNGDDTLSYQELFDAAGQAAAQFKTQDCEHLALLDVSSLAFPIAVFASAWAGRPVVPFNYRLAGAEVEALLERVQPALLVTDEERVVTLAGTAGITTQETNAFIHKASAGTASLEQNWSMDPEDVAVLLFTSGTTGAPKAAVLRHRHLVSYLFGTTEFGSDLTETALVAVPPYHIAGVISVLSAVFAGRTIVQMPNFNARGWIKLARKEKITTAFLVPTMLAQIVKELEMEGLDAQGAVDLPHLKALAYGGGKMPQPVIEKAMALLPHVGFTQAYGLTETASTLSVLRPADHRDALASDDPVIRRRVTSVGRLLPGLELQIRDQEGNVLQPSQRGEIFVRGEQVSGEYVGRGSVLDADGWFPTRDAGEVDDEGFIFLEGRADDVIVRGAENMSPGEIEDVLVRHPSVADVGVVGVPDEHWGEAVAAVVVLKPDTEATVEELQAWVKATLRSSRVPQVIRFVPELPYNETGKLLRRTIRIDLAAAKEG
ncbi:MAG: long-chain acyl-CoA synthetase [Halioglobus sp.]|jgi:long-chain acyl-CoA synthetase